MIKEKLSKKNWFIITLFCFMGGIAWNTENMYFNTFITNEIYADDDFEISYNEIGETPFSQAEPPVTVKAKMQQINWGLKFPYRSISRKTPKSRVPVTEVQETELCPYGCARLRMTEMPVLCK